MEVEEMVMEVEEVGIYRHMEVVEKVVVVICKRKVEVVMVMEEGVRATVGEETWGRKEEEVMETVEEESWGRMEDEVMETVEEESWGHHKGLAKRVYQKGHLSVVE
ncbi:hypothetical protein OWV82_013556 [Melia azedarach]|uniref:Uncharacterized protein n=1 Tax=Melia azedarach TaxID=155640 RepID=A0ACC1XVK4_MELAZ|nr:hypothetical protein OWV82_013556 [Melia azedarach]